MHFGEACFLSGYLHNRLYDLVRYFCSFIFGYGLKNSHQTQEDNKQNKGYVGVFVGSPHTGNPLLVLRAPKGGVKSDWEPL